jgi:hypothetical protein
MTPNDLLPSIGPVTRNNADSTIEGNFEMPDGEISHCTLHTNRNSLVMHADCP